MKKGDYSCMCGSDKCYTCWRRVIRNKMIKKKQALGLRARERYGR